MRKPASVYVFENGMAIVFDKEGRQIEELQGRWAEKAQAIAEAATSSTRVYLKATWKPQVATVEPPVPLVLTPGGKDRIGFDLDMPGEFRLCVTVMRQPLRVVADVYPSGDFDGEEAILQYLWDEAKVLSQTPP